MRIGKTGGMIFMTYDVYYMSDETTIHVYEGMKCVGIFNNESKVPEFVMKPRDLRLRTMTLDDGADRDGDIPKDYSHKPNGDEARFKKITKEMVDLYSRKNTDYGGSFDESLDEDGLLVSKIRLKDKLNRFSQLINNEGLVEDESLRDTLIDLANYSVMTLMWLNDENY